MNRDAILTCTRLFDLHASGWFYQTSTLVCYSLFVTYVEHKVQIICHACIRNIMIYLCSVTQVNTWLILHIIVYPWCGYELQAIASAKTELWRKKHEKGISFLASALSPANVITFYAHVQVEVDSNSCCCCSPSPFFLINLQKRVHLLFIYCLFSLCACFFFMSWKCICIWFELCYYIRLHANRLQKINGNKWNFFGMRMRRKMFLTHRNACELVNTEKKNGKCVFVLYMLTELRKKSSENTFIAERAAENYLNKEVTC